MLGRFDKVRMSADLQIFFSKKSTILVFLKKCFKNRKQKKKKDVRKQKRYPIVSLLCGLFCFRHQKYHLALATFLERCKICEVDVKNVTEDARTHAQTELLFYLFRIVAGMENNLILLVSKLISSQANIKSVNISYVYS